MDQVIDQDLSERIRENMDRKRLSWRRRRSTLAGRRASNFVQSALGGRGKGSRKTDQRPGNG